MPEWKILPGLSDYSTTLSAMEKRVAEIIDNQADEAIWLLEHPPLYTAGTSAQPEDLKDKNRFPVFSAGRGGQYTYHGPGQRVIYIMLDLRERGKDVRAFVQTLENWVIATLSEFNIKGELRSGRVGVWVERPDQKSFITNVTREDKIAAIGIKLRHWVSFHGISINIDPDLSHYSGITPCGISQYGVTSLVDLGLPISMAELDSALIKTFSSFFTHR